MDKQINPLAMMWAKRQVERAERAELRAIIADMRESQANLAPLLAEANARRKASMRQDGATGFVMVQ